MQAKGLVAHRSSPVARPTGCRRHAVVVVRATIDPIANPTVYTAGKVFAVHGPDEWKKFAASPKLSVLMCKSSHCRPCKKYMATYHSLASVFKDSYLLEIVGDESKETRKMMMDMKVKVTPTFFVYRDGQEVYTQSGIASNKLPKAIVGLLQPAEAGSDWRPPTMSSGSDSEED